MKHLNEDYSYINEISMKEENEAIEAFRLREAKNQRSIENATNLYQLGVDDDTIIKGTGITLNQLEEIKKKIKNEK